MISSWLIRNLGSTIAPDENFPPEKPVDEQQNSSAKEASGSSSPGLVEIAMGSPAGVPPAARAVPPASAFLSPGFKTEESVVCEHCNKMTPLRPTTTTTRNVSPTRTNNPRLPPKVGFTTPPPTENESGSTTAADNMAAMASVERLTMSAAKETWKSFSSPPAVNEQRNKIMRLCGSSKPLNDQLGAKLKRLLANGGQGMRTARASKLGLLVPDGYTPLMAAAYAGNTGGITTILDGDVEGDAHLLCNTFGQRAIHIAIDNGREDAAEKLLQHHNTKGDNLDTLVDISGRTPYGTLLTSRKAEKLKKVLEPRLFSPTNLSIIGSPEPKATRQKVHRSLAMAYGHSGMPGFRVHMEDAICTAEWENNAGDLYCLLGVCDGHGDEGKVAELVAQHVAALMQTKTTSLNRNGRHTNWEELWSDTCLEVDRKVKERGLAGGSTAVFALFTPTQIIVANVGDSRCILVQTGPVAANQGNLRDSAGTPELVDEVETVLPEVNTTANGVASNPDEDNIGPKVSAADATTRAAVDAVGNEETLAENSETEPAKGEATPQQRQRPDESQSGNGFVAVPLSRDHKPEWDQETKRIEKAGLSVVPETYMDETSKLVTIHKVQKTDSNRLAVSRAFGDFEYKRNKECGPEEQAVTAMPDVRIHERDPSKDMFLVLACDGIWDVMSNKDVAQFVVENSQQLDASEANKGGSLAQIGDDLVTKCCFELKSADNMSVVVAALSKCAEKFSRGNNMQGRALVFPENRVVESADV